MPGGVLLRVRDGDGLAALCVCVCVFVCELMFVVVGWR